MIRMFEAMLTTLSRENEFECDANRIQKAFNADD
jgi:hypothetical protein